MTWRSGFAAALFAVKTAGCAGTVIDPLPPEVRFESYSLRSAASSAQAGELVLRVRNPNRFDLSGGSLRVNLEVEGGAVAEAASAERVVLPPGSEANLRLQTRTNLLGAAAALPVLATGGDVAYSLRGVYAPDILNGREVPITQGGRLRIARDAEGGLQLQTVQ